MKTFAIGDCHGTLAKLESLLKSCRTAAGGQPATFVFLGDYIDRGPHSKEVVEMLIALSEGEGKAEAKGQRVICLLGNHEALALAALARGAAKDIWLANGGRATLRSYGVDDVSALPSRHLDWFRSLPRMYDDGLRFFVHAGVDPERSLADQDPEALLWIREPFLSDQRNYGRLVVHGHTPIESGIPDLQPNRLNLDTGAVYGGPLTAAIFGDEEAAPIEFIRAYE